MADNNRPQNEAGDDSALDLGVLDGFVGYHLRRASAAFGADFNRVLGDLGMRQVPFAVLTMIARHPGSNQGKIGKALGIQRANMVALIGDLVAQGLVERSSAVDDRRAFALDLSTAGAAMVRKCLARIAAHEEAMLTDFTVRERDTLVSLLERIESKER